MVRPHLASLVLAAALPRKLGGKPKAAKAEAGPGKRRAAEPPQLPASTTPISTAHQWAPAAATTWPCQMARAKRRRLLT